MAGNSDHAVQPAAVKVRTPWQSLPWGPLLAALLLVVTIGSIAWFHRSHTQSIGRSFELIDSESGRLVSDRDFHGKWLLVFFGYTHCPDVCPATLGEIADTLTKLGPLADRVQPLFITLDPKRDTQQVLADYTAAFDPRILALTGTADQIAAAARAYGVYFATREAGGDYSIDHSAAMYLMRPDGGYERSFLSTAGSAEIAKRLHGLLQIR